MWASVHYRHYYHRQKCILIQGKKQNCNLAYVPKSVFNKNFRKSKTFIHISKLMNAQKFLNSNSSLKGLEDIQLCLSADPTSSSYIFHFNVHYLISLNFIKYNHLASMVGCPPCGCLCLNQSMYLFSLNTTTQQCYCLQAY